jgi:hypothetical protein
LEEIKVMNLRLNRLGLAMLAGFALSVAACGDDDNGNGNGNGGTDAGNGGNGGTDAGNGGNGGTDAGTDPCDMQDCVDLTFTIDDSANNSLADISGAEFRWNDFNRGGEIPLENDGNGVWSITVQEPIPSENADFGYGAMLFTPGGIGGQPWNQWIWAYDSRSNGSYTIPADAADGDEIIVPGLTIPAHGDWDIRITLDTNNLVDSNFDPSTGVAVKLSRNAFFPITIEDGDDGMEDGIYTFVLSEHIGANASPADGPNATVGLLAPGERTEFIWESGAGEYKADGLAPLQGVTVELQDTSNGGGWVQGNILRLRNDRNTAVIATPDRQIDFRVLVDKSAIDTNATNGVTVDADTPVNFTSSYAVTQSGDDTFTVVPMFDDGLNGDETADDGIYTFRLGEWVGGAWANQNVDLRESTLFAAGGDPLGRDPVPDGSQSRFKVRFADDGWYGSLDGVTVQFRMPGGEWMAAANIPDVGGDFGIQTPAN